MLRKMDDIKINTIFVNRFPEINNNKHKLYLEVCS